MRLAFLFCLAFAVIRANADQVKIKKFYSLDINADGIKDIIASESIFENGHVEVFDRFTIRKSNLLYSEMKKGNSTLLNGSMNKWCDG
jgi:hypothetical protein